MRSFIRALALSAVSVWGACQTTSAKTKLGDVSQTAPNFPERPLLSDDARDVCQAARDYLRNLPGCGIARHPARASLCAVIMTAPMEVMVVEKTPEGMRATRLDACAVEVNFGVRPLMSIVWTEGRPCEAAMVIDGAGRVHSLERNSPREIFDQECF